MGRKRKVWQLVLDLDHSFRYIEVNCVLKLLAKR